MKNKKTLIADSDIFYHNLQITQEYCHRQLVNNVAEIAKALRTLNMKFESKNVFYFEKNLEFDLILSKWSFDLTDNFEAIEPIFQWQIEEKTQSTILKYPTNLEGRIVVSEFGSTVLDGASEIESEGFFDFYDLPPIDTWFYFAKTRSTYFMFAWMPKSFINNTQKAIDVNCLDIIRWF